MLNRKQLAELRRAPLDRGNRLRQAMRIGKVTQVQLAAAVGVAQSQVSEDVNGKFSEMSLNKAREYAAFFGCSVDDLFPAEEAVA